MSANGVKSKRPSVGAVWDVRCHTDLMVGPKQLPPNQSAVDGKDGWMVVIDDELRCVWIGYQHNGGPWWSRVDWDNVRYCRYHQPALKLAETP